MTSDNLIYAVSLVASGELTPAVLEELGAPKGARIHFIAPKVEDVVCWLCVRWRIDTHRKGPIIRILRGHIDEGVARLLVHRFYNYRKAAVPCFTDTVSYCCSQDPEVIREWEAAIERLWA